MFLRSLKKKFVSWLGPWSAWGVVKILAWTMRFEEIHPEIPKEFWDKGVPAIGAFWHGRLLMMPVIYRGKKLSFLVSPHRDGQVIGEALKHFGFHPIFGSTTRKGFSGFKNMIRGLKNGSDVVVVPDGPRGPHQKAQIGLIELSRLTGRPIVPLTFSASRKILLNSWDRFLLPYPFSRGIFIWGEPIYIDKKGDRDYLEEKRQLLEKRLSEMTEEADHYFDH